MREKYQDLSLVSVGEGGNTYLQKIQEGFFEKYLSGDLILDIGNAGMVGYATILKNATGIDLDFPGYDGRTLPFNSGSIDGIWASHVLEHIPDYTNALRDWHRVLKVGAHMAIIVPHMHYYERKERPPSKWNGDHRRFYTPARLLREIEESLSFDGYRICHLRQNCNESMNYQEMQADEHSPGPYEIECVIKKIASIE